MWTVLMNQVRSTWNGLDAEKWEIYVRGFSKPGMLADGARTIIDEQQIKPFRLVIPCTVRLRFG